MLDELFKMGKRAKKILAKADGMWRGETHASDTFDGADRLEQLNKWAQPRALCKLVSTIQIHYLTQQGNLLNAFARQVPNLIDNIFNRATPLCTSRLRHDAKRAVHVAALHNRNERGCRCPRRDGRESPIANRALPRHLQSAAAHHPYGPRFCDAQAHRRSQRPGETSASRRPDRPARGTKQLGTAALRHAPEISEN